MLYIMLNLIVKNQAEIPIFIQAANGNQSDQAAFRSIVSSHVGELRNLSGIEYMVADIVPTPFIILYISAPYLMIRVHNLKSLK